jgi:hypothetical protein
MAFWSSAEMRIGLTQTVANHGNARKAPFQAVL